MGGNLEPTIHHQALPTILEIEHSPGLKDLVVAKLGHRGTAKQPAKKMKKKPAAAKRVVAAVAKKPAMFVVKKPAAAVSRVNAAVRKPGKQVAKKPASSFVG